MAEGLTGNLAQLPLRDILTMLSAGAQTGRLELASANERGDIYLRRGALVHAAAGPREGVEALTELLAWPGGAFRFQPQVMSAETTIDEPLEQLLADCARQASQREAILRVVPSAEAVPQLSQEAPANAVTLQPEEWRIVARVDGTATIASLANAMRTDEFALMEAFVPLVEAGLVKLDVPAKVAPMRQYASPSFFVALTSAVAAAMGPLAEIIIDDAVEDLGGTRETFPRELVSALAERIGGEIRDPEKRLRFQQTMLASLRAA